MSGDYYSRSNVLQLDGTRTFQTQEDRDSETQIASLLGQQWSCEFHRFGALAPVDWYALRHQRIVGIAELKARSHASDRFGTVFLNVRKWLALQLGAIGLGVPAIFVVKFTDCAMWIPLSQIDARDMRIGGCSRTVKSESDVEPVIEVVVAAMRLVKPDYSGTAEAERAQL